MQLAGDVNPSPAAPHVPDVKLPRWTPLTPFLKWRLHCHDAVSPKFTWTLDSAALLRFCTAHVIWM